MKKSIKTKELSLLESVKIEKGVEVGFRSSGSGEMHDLLAKMEVKDSVKLPKTLFKQFAAAKTSLKRLNKKVFIYRNLDKYSFRIWRLADGTVLTTRRNLKKAA
jgi:hypothetical protein